MRIKPKIHSMKYTTNTHWGAGAVLAIEDKLYVQQQGPLFCGGDKTEVEGQ